MSPKFNKILKNFTSKFSRQGDNAGNANLRQRQSNDFKNKHAQQARNRKENNPGWNERKAQAEDFKLEQEIAKRNRQEQGRRSKGRSSMKNGTSTPYMSPYKSRVKYNIPVPKKLNMSESTLKHIPTQDSFKKGLENTGKKWSREEGGRDIGNIFPSTKWNKKLDVGSPGTSSQATNMMEVAKDLKLDQQMRKNGGAMLDGASSPLPKPSSTTQHNVNKKWVRGEDGRGVGNIFPSTKWNKKLDVGSPGTSGQATNMREVAQDLKVNKNSGSLIDGDGISSPTSKPNSTSSNSKKTIKVNQSNFNGIQGSRDGLINDFRNEVKNLKPTPTSGNGFSVDDAPIRSAQGSYIGDTLRAKGIEPKGYSPNNKHSYQNGKIDEIAETIEARSSVPVKELSYQPNSPMPEVNYKPTDITPSETKLGAAWEGLKLGNDNVMKHFMDPNDGKKNLVKAGIGLAQSTAISSAAHGGLAYLNGDDPWEAAKTGAIRGALAGGAYQYGKAAVNASGKSMLGNVGEIFSGYTGAYKMNSKAGHAQYMKSGGMSGNLRTMLKGQNEFRKNRSIYKFGGSQGDL